MTTNFTDLYALPLFSFYMFLLSAFENGYKVLALYNRFSCKAEMVSLIQYLPRKCCYLLLLNGFWAEQRNRLVNKVQKWKIEASTHGHKGICERKHHRRKCKGPK